MRPPHAAHMLRSPSTSAKDFTVPPSTLDVAPTEPLPHARRKRLPKRRKSKTTAFTVGGAAGYLTVGEFPNGQLGEIFLRFGKQGSTLAGVLDAFSIAVSLGLQHGVPLETFVEKFANMRFEPAGMTDDLDVRMAQSLMDYVFRRLDADYGENAAKAGSKG